MDSTTVNPLLKLDGLRVSYGKRHILTDFGLELTPNTCTAIVGYSGCGKTSVLNALVGFVRASSGEAWFQGEQFLSDGQIMVRPWSLRRHMTIVPQQAGLLPHKTVVDNLLLGPMKLLGLEREEAVRRVQEIAARLGIADCVDSFPMQLSGGQLQRAHLARALVLQPEIVLLDEVTSNVDPRTSDSIREALVNLRDTKGISIILVSHDFAIVKRLADRVIFLHEGRNFEEIPQYNFPNGFLTPEAKRFAEKSSEQLDDERHSR